MTQRLRHVHWFAGCLAVALALAWPAAASACNCGPNCGCGALCLCGSGLEGVAVTGSAGAALTGLHNPFDYQSAAAGSTGIDIRLTIGALGQVNSAVDTDGIRKVTLAAPNTAFNLTGTPTHWGPSSVIGGVIEEHPHLQFYMFRLDPGQEFAQEIGRSGIKHFFTSVDPDGRFMTTQDSYGFGLNADPFYYGPEGELDPVTGRLIQHAYFAHMDENGNEIRDNTPLRSAPLNNYLLQVDLDDLDPTLHPGSQYFLVAQLYVLGDENVANNSGWAEYRPTVTAAGGVTFAPLTGWNEDIRSLSVLAQGGPAPAIPEPSALALLGLGVAGLAAYGWRRKRAAA